MRKQFWLGWGMVLLLASGALAEEKMAAAQSEAKPRAHSTQHSIRIDGEQVTYTATVGWSIMRNDQDKPIARFGYTAYTRDKAEPGRQRPIMFAFNGGPGSSSIWLHMGILGPQRVVVNDAGFTPPPPARRVDNAFSVIDVADLVMIDPVGTGFSKPLGDTKGDEFWGVDQDIESVGAFIKKYVSENGRWASPKYILGESYGGIRSAGLVWHLQNRHGMNFNGVIIVSPFLSMVSGMDGAGIDMPHVLFLSTLAATAWYHGLLAERPSDLEQFLAEVEQFAFGQYASALMQGYTISDDLKRRVAVKLAAYTGTDVDYWMKADLRVAHGQYLQHVLRGKGKIAGRIDSRFLGPSVNPLGERMDYDPFFPSVGPAYTAAFFDYLHHDLEFGRDETYVVSSFGLDWDWTHRAADGGRTRPWADLRDDLARAMTTNPGLHLLVQQGYYDLATPVGATNYDIAHLDINAETRRRIQMAYYEAGHMMYLHEPSRIKFRQDLVQFIADSNQP